MQNLLTQYRRDLHRIPETGFDLPCTLQYVKKVLEQYPCTLISPCESSLCAFFDAGKEKTTAFRADMDALPILEHAQPEYVSQHTGKMHACGHDGHMAMVLALAKSVSENISNLPRNILLVFQPAEETTGGARLVCESGIFEKYHCDRIIGWHLWPDLPKGVIASRPGPLLARASEITITILGKSSHVAKPQDGADALFAAAEFISLAAQRIEELGSPQERRLLKFGKLESGQARNAISAQSTLLGTLRVYSEEMFQQCKIMMETLAKEIEEKTGCRFFIEFSAGYPPVCNHNELFYMIKEAIPDLQQLQEPLMIAEDFSFYQQYIPGVFLLLGIGNGIPLHSDIFDFDENVLLVGLETDKKLMMLP